MDLETDLDRDLDKEFSAEGKTLPRLCGMALALEAVESCWVLHGTGGMTVKNGAAGEADP